MSPEELASVEDSWTELRHRRTELVEHLADTLGDESGTSRAQWLVAAVTELVGLLVWPSRLGERARQLAASWPSTGTMPSFAVEGRAWMTAARAACPSWTDSTERAWRHAWLLLSEVLASEALSPFARTDTEELTEELR